MPLCSNTYRRGAIYWWRARFAGGPAASRTIALSLRVYDPARARLLGLRLNAEAERLRRRVEAGMIKHGHIEGALSQALEASLAEEVIWTLSEEAKASLATFERDRTPPPMPLEEAAVQKWPSRAKIDAVVAGIAAVDAINLRDAAECSRLVVGFDDDGYLLGIDNQPRAPEVMAAVYKIIAHRGAKARLTLEDEATLAGEGCTRADIDAIRSLVLEVGCSERRTSWRLGPDRHEIAEALLNAGIEPALEIVHAVRRQVLLSRASQLLKIVFDNQLETMKVAEAQVQEPAAHTNVSSDAPDLGSEEAVPSLAANATNPSEDISTRPSFIGLTKEFLDKRSRGMGDHSRRQYRSLAKLFVKVAGTDDPALMTQAHIGELIALFPKLPVSYGKSPADEQRSIVDIIARGEAAVLRSGRPREELIGLKPPTVNRHMGQFNAVLKYMRLRGYVIGNLETLSDARERDDEPDEDKRLPFSEAEELKLFESPPWTGCASDENRRELGSLVVHDSLYWIPLLAKYEFATLSEAALLMLTDIDTDAAIPAIEFRPNELRKKMKTPVRARRQPIHPELIRLGFLDYVRLLKSLGYKTLFPDLRLRGDATPMTNLFNKSWAPVLDLALPNARSEKKTLHSFRKTGNTALAKIPKDVSQELRFQLMGHAQISVNGKNYIAPFPDDVKLEALRRLPNTTSSLVRAELRLNRSVLAAAEHLDRSSYGLM